MSLAAGVLGLESVAAMDINWLAIEHLKLNGHKNPMLGDILQDDSIFRLQCCEPTSGCLWMASFPCQAFSRQGDQLGFGDKRSAPFQGVLKGAWLNQASMLMLECVPEVNQIQLIGDSLRALANALGLRLLTQILALEDSWPCRRTRWWAVMIPIEMMLTTLRPMPKFEFDAIDKIVGHWGQWDDEAERQLELDGLELQVMHDPEMGSDQRVLNTAGICATFLHSYSCALRSCPCGCRSSGLSPQRLARGGLRGCYVHSAKTNLPRWLHPREVALLQTLPPDLQIGFVDSGTVP